MQPQHLYAPIGNKWICSISHHSIESDLKSFHSSVCYCSVFVLSRQYLSASSYQHNDSVCKRRGNYFQEHKNISMNRKNFESKKDDEESKEAWITYIYMYIHWKWKWMRIILRQSKLSSTRTLLCTHTISPIFYCVWCVRAKNSTDNDNDGDDKIKSCQIWILTDKIGETLYI